MKEAGEKNDYTVNSYMIISNPILAEDRKEDKGYLARLRKQNRIYTTYTCSAWK